MLQGLRGGAKNEEGDVTWDRLTEFVRNRVSREAARLVGDNSIHQTPNLIANLPGECPILIQRTFAEALGIKLVAIQPGEFWMGTSAEEITLFKSVGTALEDFAAAMRVWRRLEGAR